MRHFHVGDHVRVFGLSGSQWGGRHGAIVEIFEHGPYEQTGILQECAVNFEGERRWFMAKNLMKTVSPRFIRFYQAEVLIRWQLEPAAVANLNGDYAELVALLCEHFNFATRRAQAEADDFYRAFSDRIARAIEANRNQTPNTENFSTKTAA